MPCKQFNKIYNLDGGCPHCVPEYDRLNWLDGLYKHYEKGVIDILDFPGWYQECILIIQTEVNKIQRSKME